jgi:multidrug efflux system outer membrane protein
MSSPRTCSLILLALLSACSFQPVYVRSDAPVASRFPSGAAYKSVPESGTVAAGDLGWRDFLRDARLQRLVEIALADNRDLRVAMLNVEIARAQSRIQRAALFPQISGFADASRSHTSSSAATGSAKGGTSQTYQVGVSAAWEIDFFGRLKSLDDAAMQQYLATVYARQAAEILLISQVADQYLLVLAFDEQLRVTEQTLAAARASYEIVKLQFGTGTAAELALRQAQGVVQLSEANYSAQLRGRAQAENALVLLVGEPLPGDLPDPVPLKAQAILADIPEGLPSDLLTRRPDIRQAESLLLAENANIGAARAAFFPSINLTGSLGTASSALSGLFAGGSSFWTLAPSIKLPIFNGGALAANLDVAKLSKDIGIAQYEKVIQTAFREVADGLAARGTFEDQLASTEQYTATQQRAYELSEFRYRNGIDNYLTVLIAQTGYYNAQLSTVSTRLQRLSNLVDLYRSLGGGWIQRTGDTPRP